MKNKALSSVCALALGLSLAGCESTLSHSGAEHVLSSDPNAPVGELSLRAALPDDLIEGEASLHYEIQRAGMTTVSGSSAYHRGKPFGMRISSLPAGEGFSVTLSVVDQEGKTRCTGTSDFAVEAGKSVQVAVILICGTGSKPATGGVEIGINVKKQGSCPQLSSVVSHPSDPKVGESMSLCAVLSENFLKTIDWTWAENGDFNNPFSKQQVSLYKCTKAGTQSVWVRAMVDDCKIEHELQVECMPEESQHEAVDGESQDEAQEEECDDDKHADSNY